MSEQFPGGPEQMDEGFDANPILIEDDIYATRARWGTAAPLNAGSLTRAFDGIVNFRPISNDRQVAIAYRDTPVEEIDATPAIVVVREGRNRYRDYTVRGTGALGRVATEQDGLAKERGLYAIPDNFQVVYLSFAYRSGGSVVPGALERLGKFSQWYGSVLAAVDDARKQ